MSNTEDYQAKIAEIEAIPVDEMKSPNMPVAVYIQESEDLHKWCSDDQTQLTAAGLDWTIVDDLPLRAGALREAESLWFKERFSQEEAQKQWNELSPLAFDLRDQLVHDFHFAFRNDDALSARVSEIAEGGSNNDMIQDLNDLSVLGKDNTTLLQTIGFDLTLLDTAAVKADEMAELLSQATADRADNSAARIIRDKAYTLLKRAVDEVRTVGQYIFWRDETRLKGYVSRYRKTRRSKSNTNEEPAATEE